jgi:hypothetical protein
VGFDQPKARNRSKQALLFEKRSKNFLPVGGTLPAEGNMQTEAERLEILVLVDNVADIARQPEAPERKLPLPLREGAGGGVARTRATTRPSHAPQINRITFLILPLT